MTREEREQAEVELARGDIDDDDTKLERFFKLWNRVPLDERRKVERLLAGEIVKRAHAEALAGFEPSEEYNAFDMAYHLLFASERA